MGKAWLISFFLGFPYPEVGSPDDVVDPIAYKPPVGTKNGPSCVVPEPIHHPVPPRPSIRDAVDSTAALSTRWHTDAWWIAQTRGCGAALDRDSNTGCEPWGSEARRQDDAIARESIRSQRSETNGKNGSEIFQDRGWRSVTRRLLRKRPPRSDSSTPWTKTKRFHFLPGSRAGTPDPWGTKRTNAGDRVPTGEQRWDCVRWRSWSS